MKHTITEINGEYILTMRTKSGVETIFKFEDEAELRHFIQILDNVIK